MIWYMYMFVLLWLKALLWKYVATFIKSTVVGGTRAEMPEQASFLAYI